MHELIDCILTGM